MAEENKTKLDFQMIAIAVALWFASSIVVSQLRLFARIPMGPQGASASSCISFVVGLFMLLTGLGQNPLDAITSIF